jgi:hypothetical protein
MRKRRLTEVRGHLSFGFRLAVAFVVSVAVARIALGGANGGGVTLTGREG